MPDRIGLLELLAPSVCPACDRARRPGNTLLCAVCAADLAPRPLLGEVATAIAYRGTGMELVQRFKFDGRRDALAVLIEPLFERVRWLGAELIVPVPRHPRRLRELGRDPVLALANALARRTGWPVQGRALRRTRPTPPQTGLDPSARRANVAGSFAASPRLLRGRRVLLLDDVVTTGATLAEAASSLHGDARPRAVLPVALAGTPPLASARRSAL